MATPIQMYRAFDGKLFQTEKEADIHDEVVQTLKRFSPRDLGGSHEAFYAYLTRIFQNHTLTPRVSEPKP